MRGKCRWEGGGETQETSGLIGKLLTLTIILNAFCQNSSFFFNINSMIHISYVNLIINHMFSFECCVYCTHSVTEVY